MVGGEPLQITLATVILGHVSQISTQKISIHIAQLRPHQENIDIEWISILINQAMPRINIWEREEIYTHIKLNDLIGVVELLNEQTQGFFSFFFRIHLPYRGVYNSPNSYNYFISTIAINGSRPKRAERGLNISNLLTVKTWNGRSYEKIILNWD